ncbi:Asp/Glu racemase [Xaviernesmea oryzae]|uniref:Asp/Glu racemase n=1 Tax=Xaviernesmea oryzae TaxID=464029 RepID=A0A1Q9AZL2_9HYPH|nr:aspartate/glutamate racemase family protein [Xaviernesmea oryzae]OLP61135.1 Asp/Glu racemase [Xaviernesmea oryzae]SEL22607.1 hypothetical protein SAMN04487976_106286 [Xaviernesmea oryzae]
MKIACLHTAQSNVAVFEAAAEDLGLAAASLHHVVRADLLAAVERARVVADDVKRATVSLLLDLAEEADAVVLTCSTLGLAAEAVREVVNVPVIRADRALAEQALVEGRHVIALCASATTLAPTSALFSEIAERRGASFEMRLVPGIWELFRAGDMMGYFRRIAEAVQDTASDGAVRVALVQASMAGAASLLDNRQRPLTSPSAALAEAVRQLRPH